MTEGQERTFLARFLGKLMRETGIIPKDLASHLGIVKSHLSHVLNGKQRSFNFETVAKMVEGVKEVSSAPGIQGEFLKNYLLDQCTEKNRRLIDIQVAPLVQKTDTFPDAIDTFASHLRNMNVQEETLRVFRKLLDQAENSEALHRALEALAELEIPAVRGKKAARRKDPGSVN